MKTTVVISCIDSRYYTDQFRCARVPLANECVEWSDDGTRSLAVRLYLFQEEEP